MFERMSLQCSDPFPQIPCNTTCLIQTCPGILASSSRSVLFLWSCPEQCDGSATHFQSWLLVESSRPGMLNPFVRPVLHCKLLSPLFPIVVPFFAVYLIQVHFPPKCLRSHWQVDWLFRRIKVFLKPDQIHSWSLHHLSTWLATSDQGGTSGRAGQLTRQTDSNHQHNQMLKTWWFKFLITTSLSISISLSPSVPPTFNENDSGNMNQLFPDFKCWHHSLCSCKHSI